MNGTIRYTIRPYDTFWMLAQIFNTTVESIMELNPGVDPRNLQIGHVITIRPGFQYYPSYPNNNMMGNMPNYRMPGNGTMNGGMMNDDMNGGMLNDGMMNGGMMNGGMMNGGMMNGGMMNGGMINGGMMNDGMMNNGMMNNGMMNGGMMNDGIMNRGIFNDGMMNDGMMNDGMMNDGMMNDGMMNDESEMLADLTEYFRMLWWQHIMWTRMVMLGILFDLPELEFSKQRLLRNSTDFANALRPFYGDQAAQTFESLFSEHINIAAELIEAAKASDTNQVDAIWQRWVDNANEIAGFLGSLNPNQNADDWSAMMMEHLEQISNNLSNMLEQNYQAAVEGFDELEFQAMEMADMMAEEIANQIYA